MRELPAGSDKSVSILKILDGDTLLVQDGKNTLKVRLIGVDAPESYPNDKAFLDAKKLKSDLKSIFAAGKRSKKHLQGILAGQNKIKIVTDVQKYDDYGRLLAYVYIKENGFINLQMIEDGYAKPMPTSPNLRYEKLFSESAELARKKNAGLWAKEKRVF